MNNFYMDKTTILWRISHGLKWENKLPKLKGSIGRSNGCSQAFSELLQLDQEEGGSVILTFLVTLRILIQRQQHFKL